MRKLFFLIGVLMVSLAGNAQFIRGSVKKNANPAKIDILFLPTYTNTLSGEYVNFLQFSVAIPAAGNSGVTATALGVNGFQDLGTITGDGPYLNGSELMFNFISANPNPPSINHFAWTANTEFSGFEVTFSTTNAALTARIVDLTNSDNGFGGVGGNSLFGVSTNTGDKTDFVSLFYASPCNSVLGTYTNPGSGIPDQFAQTVTYSAGTVSGNSPLCYGSTTSYTASGNTGGTWTSSNTAVASVNATSGLVTAISPGTTTITYSICSSTSSKIFTVNGDPVAGTVSGTTPSCIGGTAIYTSSGTAGGTWSSSNAAVATVNATSGLVTALSAGTTNIIYTVTLCNNSTLSSSKILTVSPNVNAGAVSGSSPLCIGVATTFSSNGNTGGTWSSSNTSVATVNATSGLVTAAGAGTTNITYTLSSGCGSPASATRILTVSPDATAGTVSGASPLCIGANAAYNSNGNTGGSWSSSNTSIATVNSVSGLVNAVSAGTTTITYTVSTGCNSPKSASAILTVSPNVNPGTVNGASPLCIGTNAAYSSNGNTGGTWSSSNTAVATVNPTSGQVTAVGAGNTNIIYTINSGCASPASSSKILTVNSYVNPGTVSGLSPLCTGTSATYSSGGDAGGTWSSSNTSVATVNATTGVVTATGTGTTTIRYTISSGCASPASSTKILTVDPDANAGTISGTSQFCIGATASYSSNGNAGGTWSSSNTVVATVDASTGLVTALSAGTAVITYTVSTGCNSPVSTSKSLTVNPTVTAGAVNGTSPLCIGATVAYSSNGTSGGSWSSSNTSVATVNAVSGMVTATGAGNCNITYTINSGCGSPASSIKALTVNPNASSGTVSGNSPLCIGSTAAYSSNGDSGGTWSSSNTSVATVDASTGAVTAVSAGTTSIIYTVSTGCNSPFSSSKILTVSPDVNAGAVTGSLQLCIGVNATYSSNGDTGGTWSSSNISVAAVNATSGVVTTISAGSTIITYTISSGCASPVSASQLLTVNPNVNPGTASGASPLCIGNTATYSSDGDAGGTWSSSNTAAATINATSGTVTATGAGTTNITYTINSGCGTPASASQALTVSPDANAGTISGDSPICIGASASYSSNGDAGGTWSSSDNAVATVDASSGAVTAITSGTTSIVYTVSAGCNNPVSSNKILTVSPDVNAGALSGNSPLCIGAATTYVSYGDGGGTWSSSNTAVATVNAASGLVTPVSAGTTTITYAVSGCGGPVSASQMLTVTPNPNPGTVTGNSPLCIGVADTYNSHGETGGTWSSSNTSVATVDASTGEVTAVGAGTTNIIYTLNSGCNAPLSSSLTLTVSPNANAGTISGASPVCIGSNTAYTSDGDAGGTWSSSDASVATVDATTGVVTAITAGTTNISYTVTAGCNPPSGSSITITVSPDVNAGSVSGTSPLCIGFNTVYSSDGDSGGAWSSSNTAVATVNATSGIVTATGTGTANIIYTVSGCGGPASSSQTLTVSPNANAGTISGSSPICIGANAAYGSDGDAGGSWSSSNTAVATVDASTGIVTAQASGSTNITYTVSQGCNNPVSSTKTLNVSPNVNPGTLNGASPLCIGVTATYTSNGDAGGTWSSSNTAVATVNASSGAVTSVGAGNTDIIYTINSGCASPASNFINLTVNPTVSAGSVSGASALCIGNTATYSSNGDAGGIWSSSNPAVAAVDASTGVVTALSAGATNITYTITGGCGSPTSSSAVLTVSPNATAGTVAGASPVCIGTNTLYSSNGNSGGTWSSSNTSVATVDAATGAVTAIGSGSAIITYTVTAGCNSPVSASKTLTVNPNVIAGAVDGTSPLCIGFNTIYSAIGATATGTWSSSNTAVATVNATSGIVTAISAGTTNITFTISSGCGSPASASKILTVSPNVTAGTVSGLSPLCIGATAGYSSNGTAGGTWSSSNTAVATVNVSTGVVTAISAGSTNITYSLSSGCGSPVSALKSLTVSPNASAGTVSGASPLCITATATYSNSGATATGTWSSSNTAVATVNATSGAVTAVSAGTTNITYTVSTGCNAPFSASRTLTVSPNVAAGTVSGTSPLCLATTAGYTSNGTAGGTWSSSNTAVAAVNATTGIVTTLTLGTTNITYTVTGCGGTSVSSKTLTVGPTLTAGTVSGNTPLCIGTTAAYTSNGSTGGTWSSSNTAVASVSAAGLVTATGAGTTNITYSVSSCSGLVSSSKNLTVNGPYIITATTGVNGTISPLGNTAVPCGGRQSYTITPNNCYKILNVLVDGVSDAGAILNGTYTFSNVLAPHTIAVTFTPAGPFTISLTATGSGTTVPVAPNTASVACGGGQTYSFTANAGNHIGTVLIDGLNNTAAVTSGSYTFTNVQTNHTVAVTFIPNCTPGTVTINANSNQFCANLTLTAVPSPTGPVYTYQWYRNGVAIAGATAQTLALNGNPSTGSYTVTAINGACVSPQSAAYSYNSQNVLQSFTILATSSVNLGDNNSVLHGSVGNTKSGATVSMGNYASVASSGAFIKASKINIGSSSNVPTLIYAPAVVTLPVMQYNTASTSGLSNFNVTTNGTYNGNYNNLTVKTGVTATLTGSTFVTITLEQGAKATFSATVLNIGSLTLKDGSSASNLTKLIFSNDCVIREKSNMNIGKYCQVNPSSKNIVFYVDNSNVTVSAKGTTIRSSIYCPSGTLQVNSDNNIMSYMTGRFIASQVKSNNGLLTWDNFDCANPPAPLFAPEAENTFAKGTVTGGDGVEAPIATRLDVKVYPNPSANSFNLKLSASLLNEQVTIRITDVSGRVLQELKGNPGQVFEVGAGLKTGIYFAELRQGKETVSVKLIKQ